MAHGAKRRARAGNEAGARLEQAYRLLLCVRGRGGEARGKCAMWVRLNHGREREHASAPARHLMTRPEREWRDTLPGADGSHPRGGARVRAAAHRRTERAGLTSPTLSLPSGTGVRGSASSVGAWASGSWREQDCLTLRSRCKAGRDMECWGGVLTGAAPAVRDMTRSRLACEGHQPVDKGERTQSTTAACACPVTTVCCCRSSLPRGADCGACAGWREAWRGRLARSQA